MSILNLSFSIICPENEAGNKETYAKNEKLSPLVREISWTNNVLIMMAAKTDEEREFCLKVKYLIDNVFSIDFSF
jgi:hypothetical protein